jgi:hypothetical protein
VSMHILLDKRDGHHRSLVAVQYDAISREAATHMRKYLDSIKDFRGGMTSWGKPIPRLQKWYGSRYFGEHWKDQDNLRWKPCVYEPELAEIQKLLQTRLDGCKVARIMGVAGASRRTRVRRRSRFGRHGYFKMRNRRKPLNSCLMNKYRDGGDSIKSHRDSEVIFGENPVVVILSIGAMRTLTFRRILFDEDNLHLVQPETDPDLADEFSVVMNEGSIVVMAGALQKYYSHEISKTDNCNGHGHGHGDCHGDGHNCKTRYSLTFRNFGET